MTNDFQIAVRLPLSVLRQVDAQARRMSRPGMIVTRTSLIRLLIVEGVSARAKEATR